MKITINYDYIMGRRCPWGRLGPNRNHGDVREDGKVCSAVFWSRPDKDYGGNCLAETPVWLPVDDFWLLPADHLLLYVSRRMTQGNRRVRPVRNAVVDMFCGGVAPTLAQAAITFNALRDR